MRRFGWALLVFVLLAAACGGDDGGGPPGTDGAGGVDEPPDQPAEPDVVTIVSDDGDLTITAPTTVADAFDLEIVLLDPSDWPEEVAGGENLPGVKVYDLLPDGASFDEPVVVTRRLDLANFADLDLGPFDVPLVTMVTRGDDGVYELLGDLTATRVGSSLLLSGSTTHFTEVLTSNDGLALLFDPTLDGDDPALALDVSAPDLADLLAGAELRLPLDRAGARSDDFYVDLAEAFADVTAGAGVVDRIGAEAAEADPSSLGDYLFPVGSDEPDDEPRRDVDFFRPLILQFRDEVDPADSVDAFEFGTTFSVPIADASSTRTFLGLNGGQPPSDFGYTARSVLFHLARAPGDAPPPPEPPSTAFGLVGDDIAYQLEVFHQQFGEYPSNLLHRLFGVTLPPEFALYAFNFDPTAPRGEGRVIDAQPMTPDGDALSTPVGIECFCPYGTGFFFGSAEDIEPLLRVLDGEPDRFWTFFASTTDVECVVRVTDTGADDLRVYDVGPEEGPFQPITDTEAFATCP